MNFYQAVVLGKFTFLVFHIITPYFRNIIRKGNNYILPFCFHCVPQTVGDIHFFSFFCIINLWCKNIEKIEKESGIDLTLAFFDADIETGFVLSNEFYDVDFSIESIIEDAFERNEKAVYDTLFEGEE